MRHIIFALLVSVSSSWAVAQAQRPLELAPGAPDRHIVVPGDTLWGIASKFLKDPYRWGELFRLNADEVKNPHRIYPGQVLVLDKSGAMPKVALETVRVAPKQYVEPLRKEISSIPAEKIEPFLTEPLVVDGESLKEAARVVGIQDNRVIAGAGDHIYVTNVAKATRNWHIFRAGKDLVDPASGESLGQQADFLGTALQKTEAVPADFLIRTSKQEIIAGDYLLPAPPADVLSYIPRAPATPIAGQILGVSGGINFAGRYAVIAINRGKKHGVERGHVFVTETAGNTIDDRTGAEKTSYKLPNARNGLIFVFRVFDRVSYALVMETLKPVSVGDVIRTP